MRNTQIGRFVVIIAVLGLCAGCGLFQTGPKTLESRLPMLTNTVQGLLYTPGITDDQLFSEAVKRQRTLSMFPPRQVKIKHSGLNVVVLVTSPDGKNAWLEDASWTLDVVDREYYRDHPPRPAEFTLDPARAPADTMPKPVP
jgi:hypothetical protein